MKVPLPARLNNSFWQLKSLTSGVSNLFRFQGEVSSAMRVIME